MKFSVQILLCNYAENLVLKAIENCYPFVDKIYIAHNKRYWEEDRPTNVDLSMLNKYNDKIEIITNSWSTEADERNDCLTISKQQGMDYMILHDHDEFYFNKDYEKALETISNNKKYPLFSVPMMSFWKTFKYVLVEKDLTPSIGEAFFAVDLNSNVVFRRARRPSIENAFIIKDIMCYHGSYVMTDEECLEKLSTWSHAKQFNVKEWYENTWLKWTPEMKTLHPVSDSCWYQAIPYEKELPEVLR